MIVESAVSHSCGRSRRLVPTHRERFSGATHVTSREYRQFARKSTKWAVETDTAEARQSFLALAKDWTFAALAVDRVEKQETAT
jgi:hypothetical protein